MRGRGVRFVFQDPLTSLNPLIPIGDQLAETLLEHLGISRAEARARAIAARVYPTTLEILELSERLAISTAEAALRRVEDRIAAQVV